jgi:hypothetical protein
MLPLRHRGERQDCSDTDIPPTPRIWNPPGLVHSDSEEMPIAVDLAEMQSRRKDKSERPPVFIKGFKIDRAKINKHFKRTENDPTNARLLFGINNWVPIEAYKYIGVGIEPDGDFCSVFTLEDGYDKAALERMPMPPCHRKLRAAADFLTPGVWPLRE